MGEDKYLSSSATDLRLASVVGSMLYYDSQTKALVD